MDQQNPATLALSEVCRAVCECLIAHEEELTCLDQAIGDGDHGFNMTRGSLAVLETLEGPDPIVANVDTADIDNMAVLAADLNRLGVIVVNHVGGAAGALYGTLIMKLAGVLATNYGFINALAEGVEAVKHRGHADLGDKTLLDVIIPVTDYLVREKQAQSKLNFSEIARIAEQGADNTVAMLAKRGRASYLGPRSREHLDPGARSCALAVVTICDMLRRIRN